MINNNNNNSNNTDDTNNNNNNNFIYIAQQITCKKQVSWRLTFAYKITHFLHNNRYDGHKKKNAVKIINKIITME